MFKPRQPIIENDFLKSTPYLDQLSTGVALKIAKK